MDLERLVEEVRQCLVDHDYRLTPQREAVLHTLLDQQERHLSAEELFTATRRRNPDIGLATVYRTLELFERLGIVRSLDYGDGQKRYELNLPGDEHYHHHLICVQCGRIAEFNEDLLEDIERLISEKTGFSVTDHCLRLFGYCRECHLKDGGND